MLLSDQVDSKQVPLPDCVTSQRIKDRRPYLNCNAHASPFKDWQTHVAIVVTVIQQRLLVFHEYVWRVA